MKVSKISLVDVVIGIHFVQKRWLEQNILLLLLIFLLLSINIKNVRFLIGFSYLLIFRQFSSGFCFSRKFNQLSMNSRCNTSVYEFPSVRLNFAFHLICWHEMFRIFRIYLMASSRSSSATLSSTANNKRNKKK